MQLAETIGTFVPLVAVWSPRSLGESLSVSVNLTVLTFGVEQTQTARPSDFLSVSQAAHTLGVHPNTVRAWTAQGVLPCLRINGRGDRRYRREDLDHFMKHASDHSTRDMARATTRGRRGVAAAAALADVAERARRADLLLAISTELGRQLDPNLVLNLLVERTAQLFNADRAAVFTRTTGGTFRVTAGLNLSDDYLQALERPTARPVAAIAFDERRVVSLRDIVDDPRAAELRDVFLREGINTVTAAPLWSDDQPMGALCLYFHEPHDWTVRTSSCSTHIAEQGATVVRNAENYSRMATWAAQLHSIQQLGARLTRLRTVDEIGQTICTELNQLIASHNIRVYRIEGEDCVPVAWRGEVGEYEARTAKQLRLKVGEGITGWVARHGLAQNLGDAAARRADADDPGHGRRHGRVAPARADALRRRGNRRHRPGQAGPEPVRP